MGVDISPVSTFLDSDEEYRAMAKILGGLQDGAITAEEFSEALSLIGSDADFASLLTSLTGTVEATENATQAMYAFVEAKRASMEADAELKDAQENNYVDQLLELLTA